MDPIVWVIILAVVVPVAIVFALAKSAALRGPALRANPRRPVESLVTEVIPEERPSDEDAPEPASYEVGSSPPAASAPPTPASPPPASGAPPSG